MLHYGLLVRDEHHHSTALQVVVPRCAASGFEHTRGAGGIR